MSLGYGGYANLLIVDSAAVLYEYGAFNWDIPECVNRDNVRDGTIIINKDVFIEPEIHQKIKKMPSGRKRLITKRIPRDVNVSQALQSGKITFTNCSHCWHFVTGPNKEPIDIIIFILLREIFRQYQEIGKIPKKISFVC